MSLPRPIRLIGVGSPHGDDAVGLEVIRRLRELAVVQAGVELRVAQGGQCLLDHLDGLGSLVVIDAAAGDRPGTIHRLEWPDPRLQRFRPASTHGLGVAEALDLAAVLGVLPSAVVVFGVEATSLEAGHGLSAPVAAVIPELIERIRAELLP